MQVKMHQQYKLVLVIFIAALLFYAVYISFNYRVERFDDSAKPQVALFYAMFCGHCKTYLQSNVFDNTSDIINNDPRFQNKMSFVKYDYDQNKDLANKYNITVWTIDYYNNTWKKITNYVVM